MISDKTLVWGSTSSPPGGSPVTVLQVQGPLYLTLIIQSIARYQPSTCAASPRAAGELNCCRVRVSRA